MKYAILHVDENQGDGTYGWMGVTRFDTLGEAERVLNASIAKGEVKKIIKMHGD